MVKIELNFSETEFIKLRNRRNELAVKLRNSVTWEDYFLIKSQIYQKSKK
jgi:hypothetical protein